MFTWGKELVLGIQNIIIIIVSILLSKVAKMHDLSHHA